MFNKIKNLKKSYIGLVIAAITIVILCCAAFSAASHAAEVDVQIEQDNIDYEKEYNDLVPKYQKLQAEHTKTLGSLVAIHLSDADVLQTIHVPKELANNPCVQDLINRIHDLRIINKNLNESNKKLDIENKNLTAENHQLWNEKHELYNKYNRLDVEKNQLQDNYTALEQYVLIKENRTTLPDLEVDVPYQSSDDVYCVDDDLNTTATVA